jgi:hypothetical protein
MRNRCPAGNVIGARSLTVGSRDTIDSIIYSEIKLSLYYVASKA